MGKGDKKTGKGKRVNGSYGKTRPSTKSLKKLRRMLDLSNATEAPKKKIKATKETATKVEETTKKVAPTKAKKTTSKKEEEKPVKKTTTKKKVDDEVK